MTAIKKNGRKATGEITGDFDDGPDYDLMRLVWRANDDLVKERARELRRHGLTIPRSRVMHYLGISPKRELTSNQLAARLYRERHSIFSLLRRMEGEGLIYRVSGRKKNILVRMTPKGEEVYRNSRSREAIQKVVAAFSNKEFQELCVYLSRISGVMAAARAER